MEFLKKLFGKKEAPQKPEEPADFVALGMMYDDGMLCTEIDYPKACEYYRKAADMGNRTGQYSLGLMYFQGHGVEQDYVKAAELFKLAAKQGMVRAQTMMGIMYAKGYGVTKSKIIAMDWFSKAAAQGDQEASEFLFEINKE